MQRHPFVLRQFMLPLLGWLIAASSFAGAPDPDAARSALQRIDIRQGVCAILGLPEDSHGEYVVAMARGSELLVFFQSPDAAEVAAVREAAEAVELLGQRVFVDQGDWDRIHLADNLAGAVFVSVKAEEQVDTDELLRVLHPEGKALLNNSEIVKPRPDGVDSWSHPFHSPDNNPLSKDDAARAPYLTQFLADPKFCPMPEISVAAGGRVYRAFGHIAHKANQNPMLNTLICVNAYNGTILWKRKLTEGFMVHRNTMIATPDTLFLADNQSCKLIDAATGEIRDEIVVPQGIADGPVWKWMALVDGVLYALVGAEEMTVPTQPSDRPGLGHWPWGMWPGHDYSDPKTNFGFGRTILAMNPATKKILWAHQDKDYLDSRGVCMRGERIYAYCPGKSLLCLDATRGTVLWKQNDADVLAAIGPSTKAQHYVTGYATTAFIKCNDDYIFFAGPQRNHLAVLSAKDGSLLWKKDHGNFQLVLREDAIYAAGPQQQGPTTPATGYKLAYDTGKVLAELPMRRACTRATGTVDSVFFRASGGTVRIDTSTNQANHIAPMRPPCQDGVIVSDGNLFWGPWMCGCQLSLYGHIALTSGSDFDFRPAVDDARLVTAADYQSVKPFTIQPGDWPTYQADNARTSTTDVVIPGGVSRDWSFDLPGGGFPTAPIAAGGMVFVADRSGAVRAINATDGKQQWQAHTGAAIYFPPTVEDGRLFVGSADGRVYAFEAASGRRLWTFRAAPAERWIPVYGKLISTWPVSGGVVVQDGVVYGAAGIAHYDGTHVFALDAATGKLRWFNDTSGSTSEVVNHGVSLQGNVYIRDGELRFVGGGVHEEARYNLATGECLNAPSDVPRSSFHTAFYAFYPDYGKYLSLDHTLPDGRSLCYDCTYEGSVHGGLMLLASTAASAPQPRKPVSRWGMQFRRGQKADTAWQHRIGNRFNSFVVGKNLLVTAGHSGPDGRDTSYVAAILPEDGSETWRMTLPGPIVKGGTAINQQQQIFIALEEGQIQAFSPTD